MFKTIKRLLVRFTAPKPLNPVSIPEVEAKIDDFWKQRPLIKHKDWFDDMRHDDPHLMVNPEYAAAHHKWQRTIANKKRQVEAKSKLADERARIRSELFK